MITIFILLSLTFHIVSLLTSNITTIILLKYQSSILYINRTILNYLTMALIIILNVVANEQSISFLLRIGFGPLSSDYAFVARGLIVFCFYTFNLFFLTINVFRIILLLKVCINIGAVYKLCHLF